MTVDYRLANINVESQLFDRLMDNREQRDGMTIVHIALQGCLQAGPIEYGNTADTGGHIRYLLELVEALSKQPAVARQIIVTRAFRCPTLGAQYALPTEQMSDGVELWRCFGDTDRYLAKEDLWSELPTLTRNLERRLCRSALWPDVIHAHYADAGWIAGQLRARFGIPFIFTAHSLGRVKAETYLQTRSALKTTRPSRPSLQRRVDIEHYATTQADLIVASSNDEVVNQYGLYAEGLQDKCAVNPPGCELALFSGLSAAASIDAVTTSIGRFLSNPERPALLALARPVTKKNLTGLLHAYGKSPQLQARANLVICAGNREDIGKVDDESSKILRELIYLVDFYDLYGRVALPKSHSVDQVPAIYQWAAQRKGLFINPAFNEPFGLTLLEAAAAGLPVVATRSGGPRDILARCKNGLLIDPSNELSIACAALTLLQNDALYDQLRRNGLEAVRYYRWSRHAQQYVGDCTARIRRKLLEPSAVRNCSCGRKVLATDLDDTLLGDPAATRKFANWRVTANDWLWVVATGRNPDIALQLLKEADAPLPDYLICAVGTEIYQVKAGGELVADSTWAHAISDGWQRDVCALLVSECAGIVPQPAEQQRQFKLSYKLTEDANAVERLQRLLQREMVHTNIVLSHDNLLDVMPPSASKGLALRHLVTQRLGEIACVIAAGDSGNDLSLIAGADAGIVVANHNGELNMLRCAPHVFWSRKSFAAGVLDGVAHFTGAGAPSFSFTEAAVNVI